MLKLKIYKIIDFTPAPTAKASDNDEEMSAGEDESPKKKTTKKSSNGKSKNGIFKILF